MVVDGHYIFVSLFIFNFKEYKIKTRTLKFIIMSDKIVYLIHGTVCINVIEDLYHQYWGLCRNRTPDAGWGEYFKKLLDTKETYIVQTTTDKLTKEQIQVLVEDLAHYYGTNSKEFVNKLQEFNLRFSILTEQEVAIENASKIKVTGKYGVLFKPKVRREKGYYWIKEKNNNNANWLIAYWNGNVFCNDGSTYLNEHMLIDKEKITRTHKIQ